MIKNLDDTVFSNDDIVFFNEDSCNVTFSSDYMGILHADLNKINLDDANLLKMILKLLLMSDLQIHVTDL